MAFGPETGESNNGANNPHTGASYTKSTNERNTGGDSPKEKMAVRRVTIALIHRNTKTEISSQSNSSRPTTHRRLIQTSLSDYGFAVNGQSEQEVWHWKTVVHSLLAHSPFVLLHMNNIRSCSFSSDNGCFAAS